MDTNVKVVVARPQDWIDRSKARTAKIWFYDVEALYDLIPQACKELGVPCKVSHITPHTYTDDTKNIFLGHHTYGTQKNMWHIKKGYVPGYMYWDKTGYSGWSEAAKRYDPNKSLNDNEVLEIKNLTSNYIENNESKIKQPKDAKIPAKPYVLVLGQRPHDTVSKHAYIDTISLSKVVNAAYSNTNIEVYTKPHPMNPTKIKTYGKTINGSIHKLIAHAQAIYTVNSGSGFESLFHGKTVFTSGASDYSPATITVKNLGDIKQTMKKRINPYTIIHYLHYCFNEHFVNCYDIESVKRKIQRCVDEYEV